MLKVLDSRTPFLFCDNLLAIHIAKNPIYHKQAKHIEINCHIVSDKYDQGFLELK